MVDLDVTQNGYSFALMLTTTLALAQCRGKIFFPGLQHPAVHLELQRLAPGRNSPNALLP